MLQRKINYCFTHGKYHLHYRYGGYTLLLMYHKSGRFRCKNIFVVDGSYKK